MDNYSENYLKHGTSDALNKLYCLNLTKQQERECKAKQKIFHTQFDTSMFSDTDKKIRGMCSFEYTKLKQKLFEQIAKFLLNYKHCYATSKFDVGNIKIELSLTLMATAIFKKQKASSISLQLQERHLNTI